MNRVRGDGGRFHSHPGGPDMKGEGYEEEDDLNGHSSNHQQPSDGSLM